MSDRDSRLVLHPAARQPAAQPTAEAPLPPLDLSSARRVLAVRLDNIGDVVMAGPALSTIRRAAPKATLTLLCSPAGREAARLLPAVDETLVARAVWQDAGNRLSFDPNRELAFVERLRAGRFDAAIIFTSFSQSVFPPAYACYLAGIPIRAGQANEFGGSVLSHAVPAAPDGTHQVERNLHLVEALGLPVADRSLIVSLPRSAIDSAHRLLESIGIEPLRPFVALAPGASAAARRYPAERYAEIAAGLADRLGWPIVVLGGTTDRAAADTIAAAGPGIRSLAGRTDVAEWATVIGAARVLVSSHSAPIHLADAVRTPVVCLFSGTDRESEWAPRDTPAVLLREPTACAPCRRFDCPIGLPCLDIAPADAVEAVVALLDGRPVADAPSEPVPASTGDALPEDRWNRFAS
ncbi:MAG TPA: glycosyltransferase family 9 protein [Candidatus Limnocylindrales bacterium]|nr:glycosyltransferase family 9 protein [Candidatus Limnocylindrales bacterium]